MNDQQLAVDMSGITKQFPGVLANNHVDFSVRPGEVFCVIGENGSGLNLYQRSTLAEPDSATSMVPAASLLIPW